MTHKPKYSLYRLWTTVFTVSGIYFVLVMWLLLLTGCVSSVSGTMYYDGRFWYSNIKSASDIAGGPRQDIIVVLDGEGRIVYQYQAAGPGVLQSLVGSLAPAVATAAGTAAAGALQRPSRNTTNVEMNVQGTGGSGGSGGSNTTSATATAPSTTTSSATGGSATSSSTIP